ncbi:cytoskeletal protein CcmA (bactofilin family) [Tenacibaculum adriaticum]|uniref:Cytoskeletal protein CcmA (Bactofilin family) n=1 Tax=Tenacibaculum adriaticum TaxID=413713 RepID=A0A5S5DY96_9FLAO|nr:polymer-forming cytoskeletal protein [Tenacibaculum adriaticum]TYP99742.1 cytoskeletal protein CcmA (bactofilin family) [Tenacibaculum adriaticum]
MFGKNKKEDAVERKTTSRNVIGKGTKIIGDVISEGDFRIDGILEGSLKTDGRVIIGQEGFIQGNVECANADIEGKFSGEFIVSDTLTAKTSANITGSVIVGQISTEPGAAFNATCNMKGAVKELSKENNDQKLKQKTA